MTTTNSNAAAQRVYQSIALSPRHIRVLAIQPSTNLEADVVCTLEGINLGAEKESPSQPYEALSYTWGPPEPKFPIVLHGSPHYVGQNCFEALRRLRWTTGTRKIFVDAICINQEDKSELSSQIALMGDVYSKAHRVLAWLRETSHSESAIIARIFRDFRNLYMIRRFLGNMAHSSRARIVRRLLVAPVHPVQGMLSWALAIRFST